MSTSPHSGSLRRSSSRVSSGKSSSRSADGSLKMPHDQRQLHNKLSRHASGVTPVTDLQTSSGHQVLGAIQYVMEVVCGDLGCYGECFVPIKEKLKYHSSFLPDGVALPNGTDAFMGTAREESYVDRVGIVGTSKAYGRPQVRKLDALVADEYFFNSGGPRLKHSAELFDSVITIPLRKRNWSDDEKMRASRRTNNNNNNRGGSNRSNSSGQQTKNTGKFVQSFYGVVVAYLVQPPKLGSSLNTYLETVCRCVSPVAEFMSQRRVFLNNRRNAVNANYRLMKNAIITQVRAQRSIVQSLVEQEQEQEQEQQQDHSQPQHLPQQQLYIPSSSSGGGWMDSRNSRSSILFCGWCCGQPTVHPQHKAKTVTSAPAVVPLSPKIKQQSTVLPFISEQRSELDAQAQTQEVEEEECGEEGEEGEERDGNQAGRLENGEWGKRYSSNIDSDYDGQLCGDVVDHTTHRSHGLKPRAWCTCTGICSRDNDNKSNYSSSNKTMKWLHAQLQYYMQRFCTSMLIYFRKMRGGQANMPTRMNAHNVLLTFIGCFICICALQVVINAVNNEWDVVSHDVVFSPTFGALSTLIFAIPAAPLAQPRIILAAHSIAVAVATVVVFAFPSNESEYLQEALSGSVAIAVMAALGVLHPPAGAVAVGLVDYANLEETFDGAAFATQIVSVYIGIFLSILLGILINNTMLGRTYPVFW